MNPRATLLLISSILAGLLCLLPSRAFASIQITEIMYDVSGTDSGREWIELTNTGLSAEDISGYKLFEDNTNHALTLLGGSAILAAGSSAVLVADQAKFLADWPGFSGTLYKASFSLSNTGETIGLKDSASAVLDSAAYDSTLGASGDGNSLARSGAGWVPSAPTPGSNTGGAAASAPGPGPTSASQQNAPQQAAVAQVYTGGGSVPLVADISSARVVLAGAGSYFAGQAYTEHGDMLEGARYIWNFGDGAVAEGRTVFHIYTYPGTYVVGLTVAHTDRAGMGRATVQVAAPNVGILAQQDGSVIVSNLSPAELNIGFWNVVSGSNLFSIPGDTIVLSNNSVRFSTATMGFTATEETSLRYANGSLAAGLTMPLQKSSFEKVLGDPRFPSETLRQTFSQEVSASASTKAVERVESELSEQKSGRPEGGDPRTFAKEVLTKPGESAAGAEGKAIPWSYAMGLGGVVLMGLAGVLYIRPSVLKNPLFSGRFGTKPDDEEFKLEG